MPVNVSPGRTRCVTKGDATSSAANAVDANVRNSRAEITTRRTFRSYLNFELNSSRLHRTPLHVWLNLSHGWRVAGSPRFSLARGVESNIRSDSRPNVCLVSSRGKGKDARERKTPRGLCPRGLGDDIPTELSSSVFLVASHHLVKASRRLCRSCVRRGRPPPVAISIAMTCGQSTATRSSRPDHRAATWPEPCI